MELRRHPKRHRIIHCPHGCTPELDILWKLHDREEQIGYQYIYWRYRWYCPFTLFILTTGCVPAAPDYSSTAFSSPHSSILVSSPVTTGVPAQTGVVSPSIPEDTSPRISSPHAMSRSAIAGISIGVLIVVMLGIVHILVSYRRGRYQCLGGFLSFQRSKSQPTLISMCCLGFCRSFMFTDG